MGKEEGFATLVTQQICLVLLSDIIAPEGIKGPIIRPNVLLSIRTWLLQCYNENKG